jgi:hypothetical protein
MPESFFKDSSDDDLLSENDQDRIILDPRLDLGSNFLDHLNKILEIIKIIY